MYVRRDSYLYRVNSSQLAVDSDPMGVVRIPKYSKGVFIVLNKCIVRTCLAQSNVTRYALRIGIQYECRMCHTTLREIKRCIIAADTSGITEDGICCPVSTLAVVPCVAFDLHTNLSDMTPPLNCDNIEF